VDHSHIHIFYQFQIKQSSSLQMVSTIIHIINLSKYTQSVLMKG